MGRIIKVRPHPFGDRIWLADVEIGRDYQPQIVWGGVPLVYEGDLVPVAPPGSWLPQGKMRRRRYRGEVSEGMLCSLAELGWDPSVTDRVALLDERAGLTPGESLDSRASDWPSIVRYAGYLSNSSSDIVYQLDRQYREGACVMRIAVVTGNPKPSSRTHDVAIAVARTLGATPPDVVVDLAEYAPSLFDASGPELSRLMASVAAADVAVFASPTYKASFTGMLRHSLTGTAATGWREPWRCR